MPFARSLPVLAVIVVSAGFWALGTLLIPAPDSYAALICSETVPDREIVERLESHGFTGLVSESGQWVLLDSFHDIEKVPLDEYHDRLLPFDPRRDPYADKLRALFVQGEKRIVYIPSGSVMPLYEKRLASALGDIPYDFEYSGRKGSEFLFSGLFILAACVFFVVRPLRLALRPDAVCLLPCLPALAPLALGGAIGFAQASLLAGCAVLLAGPCLDRLALRYRSRWGLPKPLILQLQRLRRLPLLLPFVLVGCYGVIAWFSGPLRLFLLLAFILFGISLVFSLWSASVGMVSIGGGFASGSDTGVFRRQKTGHRRFSPVPILTRRGSGFAFSWAMLPFAAVALVLSFIVTPATGGVPREPSFVGHLASAAGSGSADFSFLPPAGTITEEDYYRHCLFQSTFSLKPLYADAYGALSSMNVYEFAPDGLPRQILDDELAVTDGLVNDIPPFPLGDLVQYLNTAGSIRPAKAAHELLFALLPLLFILPAMVMKWAQG